MIASKTIKAFAVLALAVMISSCSKDIEQTAKKTDNFTLAVSPSASISVKRQKELMEGFSNLLSKVLQQDIEVRRFLKAEALKKFDLDYDVLYQMVKNKIVSNNETFRQKLLKYVEDEKELLIFEEQLPLLTIYIPELPSGFSAEKWNPEHEIPGVSTGAINNKRITYYMANGSQLNEKAELTPGFPLLVVKNNERVTLTENYHESDKNMKMQMGSEQFTYLFLSENFNGKTKSSKKTDVKTNSYCVNCILDSKVETAFNLWESYGASNMWQRDYIYYSISPSSPNGPLDTKYQETLTSIKFETGEQAYNKISDQAGDPYYYGGPSGGWSEGSFEFNLTVLISNTQGIGSTITKLFPVDPSSLFYIRYVHVGDNFYERRISPIEYNLNEPIAAWDIKNNGFAWKVIFSEVEPSQVTTYTQTHTSQFATNFGLDLKIGLKFGTSSTYTNTSTYSVVTQLGDDQLGTGAMYFSDPVITYFDIIPTGESSYTFKDVDTGWAFLTIQPKRVF